MYVLVQNLYARVYIYLLIWIRIYICAHKQIHAHVYMTVYTCKQKHAYIFTTSCVHVNPCVIHVQLFMHSIGIYAYTFAYIYTAFK